MAFLETDGPQTLEDVLGRQADTAAMGVQNDYIKKRRQSIAQQAASGRLRSGVANYQAGDLAAGELGDLGKIETNLATALGEIPEQDYLTQQNDQRKLELAKAIGEASQTGGGAMGGLLGGISGGASGAATGYSATGSPYGALFGAILGGGMGAYGGSQKRRG